MLTAASRDGLVSAAHDLSEGGLMQAVVEAALAGETGCRIVLPEDADPFVALFSESAGRVLVAVPRTEESRFTCACASARAAGDPDRRRRPRVATPSRCRASSPCPLAELRAHMGGRAPEAVRLGDLMKARRHRSHGAPTRTRTVRHRCWTGRGAWSASTSSASRSAHCSSACR